MAPKTLPYDAAVPPTHLFWPNDRKLFRQRSRMRTLAPAVAAMALVVLAVAFGQVDWT